MNSLSYTTDSNGKRVATYMLAGTPIRITSVFKLVHIMCADYITDQEPQVFISSSRKDIADERRNNVAEDASEINFESNYLETLLIYRKISLALLERNILLIHGSSIAVDGEGYLFTALSGTGKSTHTRLWRDLFGERAVMVNDDKPLIKVGSDGKPSIIYGTPWDGKHHISNNIAVPLKAIIYLERGEQNEIHEISGNDIFPVLLQQTFCEDDIMVTTTVIDLLAQLVKSVKFYDLHCNMDPISASISYSGMNPNQ